MSDFLRPPKKVPRLGTPLPTGDTDTSSLDSADTYILGLPRRRAASRRLHVHHHSGRSDPWWYEPPAAGYGEAAAHLLEHGLTPAPNVEGLRLMWRQGGRSRRNAELIAQRSAS